jgi:SAM-dependent methyltransferase
MATDNSSTGLEYQNKSAETPFETFLRYTDEKENSSKNLGSILESVLLDDSAILDIGTGNGEYLKLALSKVEALPDINLTLVEPSGDLAQQLPQLFDDFLLHHKLHISQTTFDSFSTSEQFDVILASHLFYHLPRATWTEQLRKMINLLKPNGSLIVVLREQDDAYDFKMAFKPRLFNKDFKALTLSDVIAEMPDGQFDIERQVINSELRIPINSEFEDTVSIIEFYLNKPWADIPKNIQEEALRFIRERAGLFRQRDGVAVIKKSP